MASTNKGIYSISGSWQYTSSTANSDIIIRIMINGSQVYLIYLGCPATAVGHYELILPPTLLNLNKNDWVWLEVLSEDAGGSTISGTLYNNRINIVKVN